MKFQTIKKYSFNQEDDWGCYNEEGKYLAGSFDKDGYNRHNLRCTDGKKHTLREHNMKWEFFNGEIPEGMVIDHIIPIKNGGTNKLSNLRCVTIIENANNPLTKKNISKGLKGKYVGEKHWCYGKKHSEETKKKISKWMSENQFGERNPMYGKHHTNEAKKKIANGSSKKVKQILYSGKEIIYDSATIAARENNLNNSSISMACNGKYGKYGHYYKYSEWYYVN